LNTGTHDVLQRRIVTSSDPDYDSSRATFNCMTDRRPLEIHVCADAADVVAAVRRARELGLPVSIRGGGPGVAGHCIGDGAVVIDLAGMRPADRLRASYGDTKFVRLQELKRLYDPDNVFRFNQNVTPRVDPVRSS